jgi:hypothetical protein
MDHQSDSAQSENRHL